MVKKFKSLILGDFYVMEGEPAPDLGPIRPPRLDGLELSRSGPDSALNCQ